MSMLSANSVATDGTWTIDKLVGEKGMPSPVASATIGEDGVLLGFDGFIDGREAAMLDENVPFASALDAEKWLCKVGFNGYFPSILDLKTGCQMETDDDGNWIVDSMFESPFKTGSKLIFGMQNDGFGYVSIPTTNTEFPA